MKRLAALSGIILSLISISVFADSFEDGFYYLDKTQIEKAWTITGGSKDVKIGMISTGANYKLDSLRQNIDLNTDEISANGIDDDHNGYVDDVFGINTNNKTSDPMDYHGIGSFITGLLGGTTKGLPEKKKNQRLGSQMKKSTKEKKFKKGAHTEWVFFYASLVGFPPTRPVMKDPI